MFNIGSGEMVVIFLLALLVLGPERLPKAMGQVGKAVAQMRKLSSGFQDEIRRAMDPIEAPFRPGEETLQGPVPSVTDEVRVVAVADPEDDAPAPVDLVKPEAPEEPAIEPETLAPVVEDVVEDVVEAEPADEPAPRRGNVTPMRPRIDPVDDSDGGDRATG